MMLSALRTNQRSWRKPSHLFTCNNPPVFTESAFQKALPTVVIPNRNGWLFGFLRHIEQIGKL